MPRHTVLVYLHPMTSYSDTLAAHLKARDLTDQEFGEQIGVKQPTVCRYRKGDRFPDANMARKIHDATDGAVPFDCWLREFNERAGIAA